MNVIWLSPDGHTFDKTKDIDVLGTISMPLATMQDAMNKIEHSSKKFWSVQVTPGFYSDSFIIPSNKFVCIIGTFRGTMLGDCEWNTEGRISSMILIRDVGIGKLKINSGYDATTLSTAALENISVNEIVKEGNGKVDIAISGISAASSIFAGALGAASVIYGDVNTDSYFLGTNTGFLGGNSIICDNLHLQDCIIEQNIQIHGDKALLKGTEWLRKGLSVAFINSFGILKLDKTSHNSFIKNNISIINGKAEEL